VILVEESRDRLVVKSTAKLNLFLEVMGRRADGYHEIETLFQEVAIFDELTVERAKRTNNAIEFTCDVAGLAPPGANLVERAARAFLETTAIREGVRIHLRKSTPPGLGLGAGSANATATLLALQKLFDLHLPHERMLTLAAYLGSDCAFFVRGGAAIGRGRGELLESVATPRKSFLVVAPHIHCSTSGIYEAVDRSSSAILNTHSPMRRILDIKNLWESDQRLFESEVFNRLEQVAFELFPQLSRIASVLKDICQTPVHLTGSGSALFAICDHLEAAKSLESQCQQSGALRAAVAGAGTEISPPSVRTFVTESLEQRSY
jgi:4-diphosphocytidyl-2-C-methyl-D-erythritol kinase